MTSSRWGVRSAVRCATVAAGLLGLPAAGRVEAQDAAWPPPMAPPPPRMAPPPPSVTPTVPAVATPAAPAASAGNPPGSAPCRGTRIGTLCFSAVSKKLLLASELDDYCASLGMKVPGMVEYRYAMPKAPAGLFPPGESIAIADARQYNRNLDEMGSVVVWYAPGSWNHGPVSAGARLPVVCVDRLLASREATRLHYVGVSKERVAELSQTSTQKDAMWCWAAVAQMILALRGQRVEQGDIVQATLGDNAKGISSEELARRLHKVGIDAIEDKFVAKQGVKFQTSSDGKTWKPMAAYNPLGEADPVDNIDSRQLARELHGGTVYILAYGTGASRAHAVLLVGIDLTMTPDDDRGLEDLQLSDASRKITIKKYHVVNPWPGKGYQQLSPDELQELVKWKVHMSRRRNHE